MANKKWPLFLCLLLLGQEFALTRARLEDLPSTYERLSSSKTVEGLEETGLQLRHPELDDIILDSGGWLTAYIIYLASTTTREYCVSLTSRLPLGLQSPGGGGYFGVAIGMTVGNPRKLP